MHPFFALLRGWTSKSPARPCRPAWANPRDLLAYTLRDRSVVGGLRPGMNRRNGNAQDAPVLASAATVLKPPKTLPWGLADGGAGHEAASRKVVKRRQRAGEEAGAALSRAMRHKSPHRFDPRWRNHVKAAAGPEKGLAGTGRKVPGVRVPGCGPGVRRPRSGHGRFSAVGPELRLRQPPVRP